MNTISNDAKPNVQWRELVSRLIKAEMSKKKLKYDDLSELLSKQGTVQTAANLRNKINRGILGADLLLQLLFVMNVEQVSQSLLAELLNAIQKEHF